MFKVYALFCIVYGTLVCTVDDSFLPLLMLFILFLSVLLFVNADISQNIHFFQYAFPFRRNSKSYFVFIRCISSILRSKTLPTKMKVSVIE